MTNKIHNAFEKVKASEELKASTMEFLQAQRENTSPRKTKGHARKAVLAAACSLLLFIGIFGYYTVNAPVSYISIDVNPSVELTLNRFDRVISVESFNSDGEIVLKDLELTGKLYTEAIDIIVESDAMQPYLAKDASLTFTVASNDANKKDTLLAGTESCSGCQKYKGQSCTADADTVNTAHENGLSFGKYSAYLTLSKYDSSVTIEDCKNMNMAEIHRQINEHQGSYEHNGYGYGNSDQSGSQNQNEGSGQGQGSGSPGCTDFPDTEASEQPQNCSGSGNGSCGEGGGQNGSGNGHGHGAAHSNHS